MGTGVVTIPALSVRRAETTIELGSGQSFAIAGLLQKSTIDQSNALPGLGELPVLGALFKSTAFQHGQSELVIIVTPYIVRPVSNPTALRTPIDHYHPATDLDRILFGRQLARVPDGMPALDAGFILK
jgi:pilus assembly protein CpaC